VLLTEEADIRKIKAGPDVHCPYCHARNPGDAEYCGACGGNLADADVRESGRIVGAFRQQKGLEKECPNCGTLNPANALECSGCGGSLSVRPEAVDVPSRTKRRSGMPKYAGFGCLAIILIGAAILLFSLFSKEELTATVHQVEWERSVPVLTLALVEQEDWRDQIPLEAEDIRCQEQLRETSDEPVPGALEVCGTPFTIDEGSGYGEVVQECVYEVYDDFCSYSVMDWTVTEMITVAGRDLDPYWPDVQLQDDQQSGPGEEEYTVVFRSGSDSYRYSPNDEVEFTRFDLGSTWVIEVNQLGGVSVIETAR
jgi:ribosomal protein L40E